MTKLEDITVGSSVKGIISNSTVTIVAVQWYGNNVLEITYKDSHGQPGNQMLLRDEEINLTVMDNSLPWSFDADGEQMRLASEAYRISLAHLFDPYLAVHTSSVEPLPHQISAVYQEMLPKLPLRYVLADDPGAGKTIMTGLFIKELIARGDLKRCLIVSPGSLVEQWQDELFSKFHLTFQILTNDRMESAVTGNVFNEVDFCICRLDKLARNEQLQEKLMLCAGVDVSDEKIVGIGAGLSLFTRYKKVLNASGSGMKIHDALELIYQEILGYLKEKNADSEADTVQLEEE